MLWSATETQCDLLTGGVNFYNILKWGESEQLKEKQRKETVHRDPNTLYYGWPKVEKKTPLGMKISSCQPCRRIYPHLGILEVK